MLLNKFISLQLTYTLIGEIYTLIAAEYTRYARTKKLIAIGAILRFSPVLTLNIL